MEEYYFTKSNTPPWVFFTFLKLYNDTKSRNASQMVNIILAEPVLALFLFLFPISFFKNSNIVRIFYKVKNYFL